MQENPKQQLILLLHGYDADRKSHFFPHLIKIFQTYGKVYCPDLPNSSKPKLSEWKRAIKKLIGNKTVDLVVGHSLGGVIAMNMIANRDLRVKNLITISSSPGWKDIESLNEFIIPPISFNKLKKNVKKLIVVYSYDDPYCAFEYGMILVKQANATGIFYGNKGHFLIKTLPAELIIIMNSILQNSK